jgi:hypothetical protein
MYSLLIFNLKESVLFKCTRSMQLITLILLLFDSYGSKTDHPDDENRFVTRYEGRTEAVQKRVRGREHKKEARMVGYAVSLQI